MSKKKKQQDEESVKPRVAQELEGFEMSIDSFGEVKSSMSIDEINKFLNRKVDDKKLRDRDDLDELKQ